ncbi:MAG TPA: type II toxin-antitoxin system VapC family toxin [Terriglobales bacterium]|jgi:predicted nucleic acid-binding protein
MGVSRIFWDSNLFIYFFEGNNELSRATKKLWTTMLDRHDPLFTSTVTLGEILVKPLERGETMLCRKYEDILTQSATLIPFDVAVAKRYAAIRNDRSVKPPDAMQLACAGTAGVDLFVTNDRRLSGKRVDGVQFIVAINQVPF